MKKSVSLLATLLVITGCAHSASTYVIPEQQINNPVKTFNKKNLKTANELYVESLQSFAVDFYQALDNKSNQVFSPLSIATCFSMLYDGASGKTKEELEKMLNYDDSFNHLEEIQNMLLNSAIDSSDNKTYLDVSQSIWSAGKGVFNDEYIQKMTNYYYAELFESINFVGEGGQLVANWINHKTKDFLNVKANDLDFDINTEFVLLNTIYLKSPWAQEDLFSTKDNYESKFYGQNNESTVTFMSGKVVDSQFYRKDAYRIASLDYKCGIKLNILLPDKNANYSEVLGNKDALKQLLNTKSITGYTQSDVAWRLPKFKIMQNYNLNSVLTNLGLTEATFDTPDLSAMTELKNLYIASSHKAGIEVDNEGVKAAAYTAINVGTKTAPKPAETFVVDHPFAYSVTDSNGYPLFMGVINQL